MPRLSNLQSSVEVEGQQGFEDVNDGDGGEGEDGDPCGDEGAPCKEAAATSGRRRVLDDAPRQLFEALCLGYVSLNSSLLAGIVHVHGWHLECPSTLAYNAWPSHPVAAIATRRPFM